MTMQAGSTDSKATPSIRSDHDCFGCGDRNPIGLHLRFEPVPGGVSASFISGPEHQGFENIVHGGIISTVLDEAMAWATAHAGFWAVTGEMRIRFRLPLYVGEETTVAARVSQCRGRVISTAAELTRAGDASPVATASGTFVKVSASVEANWRARYLLEQNIADGDMSMFPEGSDGAEQRE